MNFFKPQPFQFVSQFTLPCCIPFRITCNIYVTDDYYVHVRSIQYFEYICKVIGDDLIWPIYRTGSSYFGEYINNNCNMVSIIKAEEIWIKSFICYYCNSSPKMKGVYFCFAYTGSGIKF
uniref:Uncharacterized protein n=1 Tax=Lepeophtheirus salmonis TaxID=72036 RepID=A0A0K2T320_LEPSM